MNISMFNSYYGVNSLSNFNFSGTNASSTQSFDLLSQLTSSSSVTSSLTSSYNFEEYVSVSATDGNLYEVSYLDSDGNEVVEQINLDEIDGHNATFAELAVLSSAGYISEDIGTLLESHFMDENGEIDFSKSVDMLKTVGDTIRDSINGGDYSTAMKYLAEGKIFNDFAKGTDENDPMMHYMRFSSTYSSAFNPSLVELLNN
ncbi:MAG: hypothetical protein ATN33_08535 [Epulopiscium sp. Nele67-Bin001]|nr:MAG: hypothetical protein ATN33_08535 [Epulopiscium sp. Nele67-Bin001]